LDVHDLTAAYALDALSPEEAEAYEQHLGQCERCREELAGLSEATTALAFGAVAPAPPPRLRASILDAARAERSNVVPLRRRPWVARSVAVVAAAVACVAVGLGVALSESGPTYVSATVVLENGKAMLSTSGLNAAPRGKTYEAWVVPPGVGKPTPRPAGLFRGGSDSSLALSGRVPQNAVVAVTLEPAGGSRAPTTTPIFRTRA
jgi:anti-sigma-K factor RskA